MSLRRRSSLGLLVGVAALAVATVSPVSAASSGTVTVTGGSVSTIELTIPDSTAQFGTNLTPDGVASNSSDTVGVIVDPATTSAGACYKWGGSVSVRSNKNYYLMVSAAAANNRLDFQKTDPATYATCTGGEQVATAMYTTATPAGSWTTAQTRTASRSTSFWLGLDIQWTDDPSTTVGNATLTLGTSVAP